MPRGVVSFAVALASIAACGRNEREPPPDEVTQTPPPPAPAADPDTTCSSYADTDSARAVCMALIQTQGEALRVYQVYREGDEHCVIMGPADPGVLDGGVGVRVGGEGVLGIVHGDSVPCPPPGAGLVPGR